MFLSRKQIVIPIIQPSQYPILYGDWIIEQGIQVLMDCGDATGTENDCFYRGYKGVNA
jgi:hypothetical protein